MLDPAGQVPPDAIAPLLPEIPPNEVPPIPLEFDVGWPPVPVTNPSPPAAANMLMLPPLSGSKQLATKHDASRDPMPLRSVMSASIQDTVLSVEQLPELVIPCAMRWHLSQPVYRLFSTRLCAMASATPVDSIDLRNPRIPFESICRSIAEFRRVDMSPKIHVKSSDLRAKSQVLSLNL